MDLYFICYGFYKFISVAANHTTPRHPSSYFSSTRLAELISTVRLRGALMDGQDEPDTVYLFTSRTARAIFLRPTRVLILCVHPTVADPTAPVHRLHPIGFFSTRLPADESSRFSGHVLPLTTSNGPAKCRATRRRLPASISNRPEPINTPGQLSVHSFIPGRIRASPDVLQSVIDAGEPRVDCLNLRWTFLPNFEPSSAAPSRARVLGCL